MKRWRARARGRAARIIKPTCHITVVLAEREAAPEPARPAPKAKEEKDEKPKRKPAARKRKAPAKKKEAAA
jgi:hypothetical protein